MPTQPFVLDPTPETIAGSRVLGPYIGRSADQDQVEATVSAVMRFCGSVWNAPRHIPPLI